MRYEKVAIRDAGIPRAATAWQHAVDTYASEVNKVFSTWCEFGLGDLPWKAHPRASSVEDILKHQILSERRFFAEFLGSPEPAPAVLLPVAGSAPDVYAARMADLARPRLAFLASRPEPWWLERVKFFDVERERAWVFWRRVLHTAHHRTQLTVYLRLLDRKVPSTYGPTADVTWTGADPTLSVEAAGRK